MEAKTLGGTELVTSVLGFGCASLFHLPYKSARRRILELAFDAGIRHFDVAPIYGLGRAEPELAAFIRSRRSEITVASKFGIEPTLLGRVAGLAQSPLRAALRNKPGRQASWQSSGRGPQSGTAGRLLYRAVGYTRTSAEAGLTRTLKALKTDYVDVFLLHEPSQLLGDAAAITDYLDEERDRGRIRAWGTAGERTTVEATLRTLPGLQVVQHRDDLLQESDFLEGRDHLGHISFGVLAQVLAPLSELLAARPSMVTAWNEMAGCDLANRDNLISLLLREAVSRNGSGPVLFTTTKADRLALAARAVLNEQSATEALVLRQMGTALRLKTGSGVFR